jgi:hypothetical protein
LILDEQELRRRFESDHSVVRTLRALADDIGATPIADYTWTPTRDGRTVRELRRATPVGLIGLTEEGSSPDWSLRVQVVSWKATADIAIVWYESPNDGYWEMHLGDGSPQRVSDDNVDAALAFVKAALAAVATRSGGSEGW